MDASPSKSRRHFLKQSSYAGVGIIGLRNFSPLELPTDETHTLMVLHTNDMHSHIDPFPDDDPRYPGQGGMAERAYAVDKMRAQHEHVLLLDAGDIFQGTPYFNFFGGALEIELMSKMGYDASTMGNHDFDGGMDGFLKAQNKADFPFICSNYLFDDTPLEGKTITSKVFKKGGMRIGVFGLGVELDGLVDERLCKGVRYEDPIKTAQRYVKELKQDKKCDMVICLSHLGLAYENDKVSDRILGDTVDGIDLIIGGHTHSFLDEPIRVTKGNEQVTYINQVGWAGVRMGALEFTLAQDKRLKSKAMRPKTVSKMP